MTQHSWKNVKPAAAPEGLGLYILETDPRNLSGCEHSDATLPHWRSAGRSPIKKILFKLEATTSLTNTVGVIRRRIVFNICVSNTDDHLRNHGFILTPSGWELSPAFDMNPTPYGNGLKLNISETDNSQHLDLAYSVAKYFRLKPNEAKAIGDKVINVVSNWCEEADKLKISVGEQKRMSKAFRACQF